VVVSLLPIVISVSLTAKGIEMKNLTQEQHQNLAQNIQVTTSTILSVLQGIEIKPDQKGSSKATVLMLGCIGMALTIQADIMLATAGVSNLTLVKPN
jgi:hypothetical protein